MLIFKWKNTDFPFPHLPLPPPPPAGGREKGKEKLDFVARTLTLNKQFLHSSHKIYNEKDYCETIILKNPSKTSFLIRNILLLFVPGVFGM